jgi:penicillin amidase
MAEIHRDVISIPGQTYARLLEGIQPTGKTAARARDIVVGWDGSMDRDAAAPTIYSALRHSLDTAILSHLLGPLVDDALAATGRGAPVQVRQLKAHFVAMAREDDTSLLPPGASWRSLMARALEDAVGFLTGRLGDDVDSWTWGRLHSTRPQHPLSESFPEQAPLLDPPSVPLSGDGDTPQAASYPATGSFEVTGTSVARYVFDTSDWDGSRWIVPLGASGHPGSPHYADQAPIWADAQLIPMQFDWDRLAATAESRQQLKRG